MSNIDSLLDDDDEWSAPRGRSILSKLEKNVDRVSKYNKDHTSYRSYNILDPDLTLNDFEKRHFNKNAEQISHIFESIDRQGRDITTNYIVNQGNTLTCWLIASILVLSMFPIGSREKLDIRHNTMAMENRQIMKSMLYYYVNETNICPTMIKSLNKLNLGHVNNKSTILVSSVDSRREKEGLTRKDFVLPPFIEPIRKHFLSLNFNGKNRFLHLDRDSEMFNLAIEGLLETTKMKTKLTYYFKEGYDIFKVVVEYQAGGTEFLPELFSWAGYNVVHESKSVDEEHRRSSTVVMNSIQLRNTTEKIENMGLEKYEAGVIGIRREASGMTGHAICFFKHVNGKLYYINSWNRRSMELTDKNLRALLKKGGDLLNVTVVRRVVGFIPPINSRYIALDSSSKRNIKDKMTILAQIRKYESVLTMFKTEKDFVSRFNDVVGRYPKFDIEKGKKILAQTYSKYSPKHKQFIEETLEKNGQEFVDRFSMLLKQNPPFNLDVIYDYIIAYKMKLFYITEDHKIMKNICTKYMCNKKDNSIDSDFTLCRDILFDSTSGVMNVQTARNRLGCGTSSS